MTWSPRGPSHQAVAQFLEAQGMDVVLLSSSVADWNRRTQDGPRDKHDRKDTAHGADLLEQGKVLFYSQPTGPLAELRRLGTCLRRALVRVRLDYLSTHRFSAGSACGTFHGKRPALPAREV